MDEVTRVNQVLYNLFTTDATLAAQITAWHEGKVPQGAKWVALDGHTLLRRGIYRFSTGAAIRRMRRQRIGMHLVYQLKLYQQAGSVVGLQAAADRLSTLVDGASLPWAAGQALKCAVTQPLQGADLVAGVDYSFLGYEIRLWALPTT
jgi:hypothetical protein